MAANKPLDDENPRKRKRVIPTRAAGTPVNAAFTNPADELFAEVFSLREKQISDSEVASPHILEAHNPNHNNDLTNNSNKIESGKVESSQVKPGKVDFDAADSNADSGRIIAETSPSRNFTKFTNSIVQDAIPEKYFRGQSKHTYDVLYQHTRGAVKPIRQIQLTKSELMKLTGLSDKTVQTHIKYLKAAGLIMNYPLHGSHRGWVYEIYIPQELEKLDLEDPGKVESSMVKSGKHFTWETMKNLTLLDHTNPVENKDTYGFPKTSSKTNTKNDDDSARVREAFAALTSRLDAAVTKLTGRGVSKNDAENWGTLADLLILEMEAAASRTETISSVPAFLTEVLRRKLLGGGSPALTKLQKVKLDTVGKPNAAGEYEKKPLSAQGRKAALSELQDFANEEFLADFEKWYTAADWQWLKSELAKLKQVEGE